MEFFVKYENDKQAIFVALHDDESEDAREITEAEAKQIKISTTCDRLNDYEMACVVAVWIKKYELNIEPPVQDLSGFSTSYSTYSTTTSDILNALSNEIIYPEITWDVFVDDLEEHDEYNN